MGLSPNVMDRIDEIIEENFCLKFELDTLAEVLLRSQSERWVPGFLHTSTEYSHTERYKLACTYSQGKRVIDIACGIGKGSYMLASQGNALSVSAYDIEPEAIRYASWRNRHNKINFNVANAEKIDFINQFDLAISFETIEHLPNPDFFLKNIYNALVAGGNFIVSTPIAFGSINLEPSNPYHVQEWGFRTFQELLKPYFHIDEVYVQLYPYYPPIAVETRNSFSRRVFNRIKNIVKEAEITGKSPVIGAENSLPQIELFTNQYLESELGNIRSGYQIVIARKKHSDE
jgi:2-polyprenyl-3-methyl-5-hydroxy-6-metoxy-1,4-benzoquinol methylase